MRVFTFVLLLVGCDGVFVIPSTGCYTSTPIDGGTAVVWGSDAGPPDTGPLDAGPGDGDGRIQIILTGQSNAQAGGIAVPHAVPRSDILAYRDINPLPFTGNRIVVPWGELSYTFPVGTPMGRGLDITALTRLHDLYGRDVSLIHVAHGGTAFGSQAMPSYWMPPSRKSNGIPGALYAQLVADVLDTWATHPDSAGSEHTWLVHVHGEADATNTTYAAEYEQNLRGLVMDLRADLGLPGMRVCIVRLSTRYAPTTAVAAGRALVQAGQDTYVASDPLARIITTEELNLAGDKTHYRAEDAEYIGTQLADLIAAESP